VEVPVEFRRPVMYRVVNNDDTLDISQERRQQIIDRVKALYSIFSLLFLGKNSKF